MRTAPTCRYFRPQNLPNLLIWPTPSSQTSREQTFCYKMSTPCSKMSFSRLQAVLLHAARYLSPSRARPSAPTGGVSHLRHPQHLSPKIHDFRFIVPKRRYGTITQYLLYGSHVPAMPTAPTYRYFRPQNPPKLLIWHTPSSTTSRERTFCYKLSSPCSKKSYSRL